MSNYLEPDNQIKQYVPTKELTDIAKIIKKRAWSSGTVLCPIKVTPKNTVKIYEILLYKHHYDLINLLYVMPQWVNGVGNYEFIEKNGMLVQVFEEYYEFTFSQDEEPIPEPECCCSIQ
jgi:hypothetical protein